MVIMKGTKGAFRDKGGFGVNGPAPMCGECSDSKCRFQERRYEVIMQENLQGGRKEGEEQREGDRQGLAWCL